MVPVAFAEFASAHSRHGPLPGVAAQPHSKSRGGPKQLQTQSLAGAAAFGGSKSKGGKRRRQVYERVFITAN